MSKKILIVDDDEAIVDATMFLLEEMGYEVDYTLDGDQVVEVIKNKPDLLLMDIWMSGVDGRDICKILKANPETKNIPVLMISASRENKASALASGAQDFLEKPFDMNTLLDKIEVLTGYNPARNC